MNGIADGSYEVFELSYPQRILRAVTASIPWLYLITNRTIHHEYPHDQSPLQHTSVLDRGQDLSASKTPRAETEVRPAPDSATARFPPPWPDVPGTRGHLRRHSSTVRLSSGLW